MTTTQRPVPPLPPATARPGTETAGRPAAEPGPPPRRLERLRQVTGRFHDATLRAQLRLLGPDPDALDDRPRRRALVLFGLAVVLSVVQQLVARGSLVFSGSMWAEMGTNYYPASVAPTVRGQLFALDAGYWPLPQRLFALVAADLGVPAAGIPYVYTGAALLLGAVLTATVCLPAFRAVCAGDGLRFALALALAVVPDFETRTFINVTYLTVVPAVAVTALALVQRRRDVPAWAWLLPLCMVSKPAVLAVLPAMVVTAVVSRRRFRWITAVSVAAALVQAAVLAHSASNGPSLMQKGDSSTVEKLYAAVKYSLGMLGRLLVGPGSSLGVHAWMFWGIGFLALSLAAVALLRARAAALVVIGLSLVGFTMLIDSFTFGAVFTRDLAILATPGFDRRFMVAVIGAMFVAAGLFAAVAEVAARRSEADLRPRVRQLGARVVPGLAVLAFAVWFALSGWVHYGAAINRPFGVPVAGISQWEQMSGRLDRGDPVVCVPIDPFGWVAGRNCNALVDAAVIPTSFAWTGEPGGLQDGATVELSVPAEVSSGRLVSFGVLVRPSGGLHDVRAVATVTDEEGNRTELRGERSLSSDGGLLQFLADGDAEIHGTRSVSITFDGPVELATRVPGGTAGAVALWMGQPAPTR